MSGRRFFSGKDSKVYEDNFQPFPANKEDNIGNEMTRENLTFFVKYIFMLRNWYTQNPRA